MYCLSSTDTTIAPGNLKIISSVGMKVYSSLCKFQKHCNCKSWNITTLKIIFFSMHFYNVKGQKFPSTTESVGKLWLLKCHISWITSAMSLKWKDYYIATSIPTDDIKLRLPGTTVVSVYDNQCIPIKQLFYELYGFTGLALYLKNNDLTCHLKVWCQISCFYQKVHKTWQLMHFATTITVLHCLKEWLKFVMSDFGEYKFHHVRNM